MTPANQQEQEILPLFVGKTATIDLPSGRKVKIRETNGEDDAILSSLNDSSTGENIYKFLASIIMHDSTTNKKPLVDDIKKWPLNDKYGLLFKQRLFVHGSELKFEGTCTKCGTAKVYTEDLSIFNPNFGNTTLKNPREIPPYPNGDKLELTLVTSSNKTFKYKILTGELELKGLEITDTNKNSALTLRELSVKNKEEWIRVLHFAGLSSRELNEIRKHVRENDPEFNPMISFECANPKCREQYTVSLFQISSFFFPEE